MIQTTEVSITYKGDGVQTSFPYPYPYRNSDDIVGYIINDLGYETRITTNFKYDKVSNIYQYPVAGEPLAAPYSIKLIRETPQQQNADLPGKLPFSLIEKSLDWIIMILQEIGSRCNSLWHIRNDCKLSETNARNSASAAANSEENAANSEENAANSEENAANSETMAQKWAMAPTSPDGDTDTDSPTGYTQSAKIWAALSKEYAGMSKFKLPIGYYNNVAEMKASETAIVGRPCVTLGYYEPNDGGGAVYVIRSKTDSDVDDGGSVLVLDNGNVAELITENFVNVKNFGAKGDGVTDDTATIQAAINYSYAHSVSGGIEGANSKGVCIPHGRYRTTATINLTKRTSNWVLLADTATIVYEGDDYAFLVSGLVYSSLRFGVIDATKAGGCIHFKSIYDGTQNIDWFQYINLYFSVLQAKTDCILSETENKGWGNEVRIFGGRFRGGEYGLRIENNGSTIIDKWACYNVGIEGITCGVGLHNNSTGQIWEMLFVNCRTEEDSKILETVGVCQWCQWIDPYPLDHSKISLSGDTRTFKFITGVDCMDIPHNSVVNANSLVNVGSYRIDDWNTAANSSNFPEKKPGILTVIQPDRSNYYYLTQKFEVNEATGSISPHIYQRTYYNEDARWNAWERVDGWYSRIGHSSVDVDSTNLIANQKMSFIAPYDGFVSVACDGTIVCVKDNILNLGVTNDGSYKLIQAFAPARKGHQVYIETKNATTATIKFMCNG